MEPLLIALSSVSPVLAGLLIALKLRLGKVNKLVVQQQEVIEKYSAEVNKAELVINRSLAELDSKELITPEVNNVYSPVASELLANYFKSAYKGQTMPNNGFVYVVKLFYFQDRGEVNNLFKVGKTTCKDYETRITKLKNDYKCEVEKAFVVKTNNVDRLEKQTHKLLMPYQATVDNSGFPPLGDECFVADVELIKDAIFTASKSNEITIETVFGY